MERITDRKWLQKEDNLIGKTLCIICRGFNGVNPEDGINTFRFSSTEYAIDVERIDPDPMKAVDYIYGKNVIIVDYAPPTLERETPSISTTDCLIIDYFHSGEFEKYEYYVMTREEAIEQIKNYNQQIVGDLFKL